MAAIVNVLLPNGRRQNVKVTPNTRILQVIENVCSKTSYNPNEYNLKHHRTVLDPELSIRYANLPNNCKLELVKADRPRTESAVHIALQVESGDRLQHEFAPAASLWDILRYWESQNASPHAGKVTTALPGMHPICIYLRQEIVGEAQLQTTTLKSLGLTSGKAVIRLIHRAVNLPAPPVAPSVKLTRTPPTVPIQSSSSSQAPASQRHSTSANRGDDEGAPMKVPKEETNLSAMESSTEKHFEKEPIVQRPENKLETTSKVETADELKSVNDEEETSSDKQQNTRGGEELSGGARPKQKPPTKQDLSPAETYGTPLSPEMEQQANLLGAALADAIMKHRTQQQLAQLKNSSFTDFKFPEQPVRQPQRVEKSQHASHLPEPCERHPLVFSVNQSTADSSIPSEDLPDKFFEVTVDDIRRMMADQQLQKTTDNDQILQTKAMREASALRRMQQYPKVTVRIHFPDRYVLQGFFRPLEPVGRLREFVRSQLQEPDRNFYLYTTPPRCVLTDDTQSLFKAKLFPAAVVYFGSESACDHHLRSNLLSEVISFEQAREEAASVVQKADFSGDGSSPSSSHVSLGLPMSSSASASKPSSSGLQNAQASANKRQASGESAVNSQKIPKWFKMGKK